tara:strand:- start:83 stop:340 length:258 start_codon:yes stop_codon:yes gene_type:complete
LIDAYGRARQVDWALRRLKLHSNIPWHKVINSKGLRTMNNVSRSGSDWIQKKLLVNEGIKFNTKLKIKKKFCGYQKNLLTKNKDY